MKSQISSSKFQTNSKHKIPMTKTVKVWELENLDFDIVCDL